MTLIEVLVMIAIICFVVGVFGFEIYKKIIKKDTSCSGCSGCSGKSCDGSCHDKMKKAINEVKKSL